MILNILMFIGEQTHISGSLLGILVMVLEVRSCYSLKLLLLCGIGVNTG